MAQPLTAADNDCFTCPLTGETFVDAVVDREGNTYERIAIMSWLSKTATSPITRAPLTASDLVPNRAIMDALDFLKPVSQSAKPVGRSTTTNRSRDLLLLSLVVASSMLCVRLLPVRYLLSFLLVAPILLYLTGAQSESTIAIKDFITRWLVSMGLPVPLQAPPKRHQKKNPAEGLISRRASPVARAAAAAPPASSAAAAAPPASSAAAAAPPATSAAGGKDGMSVKEIIQVLDEFLMPSQKENTLKMLLPKMKPMTATECVQVLDEFTMPSQKVNTLRMLLPKMKPMTATECVQVLNEFTMPSQKESALTMLLPTKLKLPMSVTDSVEIAKEFNMPSQKANVMKMLLRY